jgi:putative membrane protein
MNMKYITIAAAVAAFAITSSRIFAAEEKASSSEATFIKHTADANMTEIKLGKLAADNAEKQNLKDFGNRMVSDHTSAGDKLEPIAKKLNVTIPSEVSSEHQKTIDRLSKLKGAEFDKAFSQVMVKDHKKVISMFEAEEKTAKNSDLKSFVTDTLPTLKEHLSMAQKLEGSE